MITPTPGRIVWFYPDVNDGRTRDSSGFVPLAAMVAKVIHERCVNLTVSGDDGTTYGAQNIVLLQEGFKLADPDRAYAEWMPFQKGQAAKLEQVSTAIAAPANSAGLLEPVHARIDEVAAKVEQALAAPASDLEPLHAKILEIETGVQGKFLELGTWLQKTLADVQTRLGSIESAKADPATPQS
jgi:hypothetical protein